MDRAHYLGQPMINHTGINVADLARSKAFYGAALAPLGVGLTLDLGGAAGFGRLQPRAGDDPGGAFWIAQGNPHEPRTHIAFTAASRDEVIAFHAAALAAGGGDNGAPGLRPHYHKDYFAAFILDPDGYNIEAVFHGG
jgi:catechol 2,3-dioxygenase-like lactoylglutathione lyase family enzyme